MILTASHLIFILQQEWKELRVIQVSSFFFFFLICVLVFYSFHILEEFIKLGPYGAKIQTNSILEYVVSSIFPILSKISLTIS